MKIVSRFPIPKMENARSQHPIVTSRPAEPACRRSAGRSDRNANHIVTAPALVSTMMRKAAAGALNAYMSLMESASRL